MSIEFKSNKPVMAHAKTIYIHLKVSDRFSGEVRDENGNSLIDIEGSYVPDFFPEKHYGDYVVLDIDLETGLIKNWVKPTARDIELLQPSDDD
jgi:hypothetical protein